MRGFVLFLDGERPSVTALWALAAASATLNAWGWLQGATGAVALVLVTLVAASEVLGLKLAGHAAENVDARRWGRLFPCLALFAGVVVFNGYSGHRALQAVEDARVAPANRARIENADAAARVEVLEQKIAAERAAMRMIPADIPGSRIKVLQAPHAAALGDLQNDMAEAEDNLRLHPAPAVPAAPMSDDAMWAIVVLIEALKALGLWAIGKNVSQVAPKSPVAPQLSGRQLLDELLSNGAIALGDLASAVSRARWAARDGGLTPPSIQPLPAGS